MMRRRKVGSGSGTDPMKGGAGGSASSGTPGPYFGNGGRTPQAGPSLATTNTRLRKVGGGNINRFAHVAGPSGKANTVFHGHPRGGSTSRGPEPHFDSPMGAHKRHRKVGGNSGLVNAPGRAYVGPGGMNGSS